MAIVKSINEIAELIPKPDDRFYGCRITEAPSEVVTDNPLFAFRVDDKANVIIGMFRAVFSLARRGDKYYLTLSHYDYQQEEITQKDYLSVEKREGEKLELSDYPFITDDIGLRMDSDRYTKNRIYFGTMPTDVRILKEALKDGKKEEKIVELEPVIV